MNLIDKLIVSVVGDTAALKKSLADSNKQLSGFGAAVQKHSAAFMKTGAVMMGFAGAICIAAIKVGKEFDKAYNKIRTGTGATGKVLEGLKKDFRAVAKDVPNSLDEVSTAIAEINTRLGLTGKPLQAMAKQMLNLARITETDVNAVIRTSTRLFGDWDVAVEDQAETLDYLYKVSQSTGVGIDKLSDMVTTYGVQLRTVGFTMEESLALMGKWEKEGVSAEKMLGGLSMALGKFAKAQKEPEEAMRRLMEQIEEAPTVGKAMELGVEALGTRAGPDFALAVREGRFAVEDFVAELADSSETINQAAEDTMTLTEKFNLLKNQAKLAIEPLAKKLMDRLMPALTKVTDKLGDLDEETLDNIANVTLWGTAILGGVGAIGVILPKIYQLRTAIIALGVATKIAFAEWLALAAGLAHFGIDVYTYVNAFKALGDGTESWQRKFVNFIPFFDTFGVKFARIMGLTEEQIKNVDRLTGGTEELNEVLESSERFVEKYSETLPLASAAMVDLIQNYQDGTLSAEGFKIGVEELRKATQNGRVDIEESIPSWDDFNERQEIARRKVEAHTKAQKEAEGPIDDTTESIEEQEKAAEELREEIDNLLSSLFELYNLTQSVTEASWNYEDAQATLNELIKSGTASERELQEAMFGVQDAREGYIESIIREIQSEDISIERANELKQLYIELGLAAVEAGETSVSEFIAMANQLGISQQDMSRILKNLGIDIDKLPKEIQVAIGVDVEVPKKAFDETVPAWLRGYEESEPETPLLLDDKDAVDKFGNAETLGEIYSASNPQTSIYANNKPAMDAIQKVIDKKIPDKYFTIWTSHRDLFAKGGIASYLKGGITGYDGFSLPLLTAAKGLITLPQAQEGMLAVLHPPELVLNPDQALKVLWKIANEPTGAKPSSPVIHNYFEIAEMVVREEADIHKVAEELMDEQKDVLRGLGEK